MCIFCYNLVEYDNGVSLDMAEVHLTNLPPGVRFCPSDIELIRKVQRKNSGINDVNIREYSISQFKPDQLPQNYSTRGKKEELYFYDEIDPNKLRQKRLVDEEFFWRNTGSSPIIDEGTVVGQKTSFELRERKGKKTEWMMKEYSLIAAASPEGSSSLAKDMKMKKVGKFVLYKIYKKATTEGEPEQVSSNPLEDAVDEDRNDRIGFWHYIHEHADDENILGQFPG